LARYISLTYLVVQGILVIQEVQPNLVLQEHHQHQFHLEKLFISYDKNIFFINKKGMEIRQKKKTSFVPGGPGGPGSPRSAGSPGGPTGPNGPGGPWSPPTNKVNVASYFDVMNELEWEYKTDEPRPGGPAGPIIPGVPRSPFSPGRPG
jgi:hypothetical protein